MMDSDDKVNILPVDDQRESLRFWAESGLYQELDVEQHLFRRIG